MDQLKPNKQESSEILYILDHFRTKWTSTKWKCVANHVSC